MSFNEKEYKAEYYRTHKEQWGVYYQTRQTKSEHLSQVAKASARYRETHTMTQEQKKHKQKLELQRKARNPAKFILYSWAHNLKNVYGLSVEDFERLYKKQHGKCPICDSYKKLVVDHCHTKGHVRGLLCQQCNSLLGLAKESTMILSQASKYLEGII